MNKSNEIVIPEEVILSKIYEIRGKKVMLSNDLAELYQVEAKALNQQVKRNIGRFPERYAFRLTADEYNSLRSQNVTLKRGQHSKYPPYAFTEHGVLMLSNVLKSERAEKVSLLIVDTFVKLRELFLTHNDLLSEMEEIRKTVSGHEDQLSLIFEYLKKLEQTKHEELEYKNRTKIGFKR